MIECAQFYDALQDRGFAFFAGVPDSLLKNFCYFVADRVPAQRHVITANEGSAVSLAAGYHLATGKFPVVYMQNSGVGNTVNPLLSLADPEVYSIPMLLIVGWRGEPGKKDEPQHKKQGRVMMDMFKGMEVAVDVIDAQTPDLGAAIDKAHAYLKEKNAPYVLAIREDTFGPYEFQGNEKNPYPLTREAAIEGVLDAVSAKDVVVCTTGKASRELYELRKKRNEEARADFLTVGSMGHASQIALGVALQKPDRKVFCIDGDGAMMMHMGGVTTIGRLAPRNYFHILVNNGAHESVGGQGTGAFNVDWGSVAKACGYKGAFLATTAQELSDLVKKVQSLEGPILLEVRTKQGSRKELGRPKSTPVENKQQIMKALQA